MQIDVPEGKHPIMYVWGEMVPGIGLAAATFNQKVYEDSTLAVCGESAPQAISRRCRAGRGCRPR